MLGLSLSGPAHADDRPQLLDGLVRDTVTDVLDDVLPARPVKQPKDSHKPEDQGKVNDSGRGADKQPDTPVRDVIEKVKDKVKDTADNVEDVLTAPVHEAPSSSDEPAEQQSIAAPDQPADDTQPSDVELPDLRDPNPDVNETRQTPPVSLGQAHQTAIPPANGYRCGHEPAGRNEPAREQRTARAAVLHHDTPVAPDYTPPAPPTPPRPDQAATPAAGTPTSIVGGPQHDATLTARVTMPRTTAVRIPGRDQAADGMTHRPDAPSG